MNMPDYCLEPWTCNQEGCNGTYWSSTILEWTNMCEKHEHLGQVNKPWERFQPHGGWYKRQADGTLVKLNYK